MSEESMKPTYDELEAWVTHQDNMLAALRANVEALEDWQATVTAALGREGGAFFADMPKHIRGMVTQLATLTAERERLLKQLPYGMEHCTVLFKECHKGHGWLTATNWVQHGCPTCERDRLKEVIGNAVNELQYTTIYGPIVESLTAALRGEGG